jgi:hypothetical protein
LGIEQAAVVLPVPGMNILILEEIPQATDKLSGSLDAQGSPRRATSSAAVECSTRRPYTCTDDLLSSQAVTITVESKEAQGARFVVTLPEAS